MNGRTIPETPDALREEAVAWLVRVQSDAATGEDWAALADWMSLSEAHRAAFEEVELLSSEIADQAPRIAAGLRPSTAVVTDLASRRRERRPWPILGGLAAAAAVLVFLGPVLIRSYEGAPVVYRTQPGEIQDIALADGTHIRLDAASQLTVRLGWRTRKVAMADAEASFDVAKDPNRPFLVTVGDQQVRVVGTEFNIRHFDRSVVVTVRRGIVEVRQPALGALPIARLTVGQELRHLEGASQSARLKVNPETAFAWTEGRLICEDRPLSEIVADLNRRYATRIVLAPAAAGKRFSGVLELGDQDALVRRLGAYLSLPVRRAEHEITLG